MRRSSAPAGVPERKPSEEELNERYDVARKLKVFDVIEVEGKGFDGVGYVKVAKIEDKNRERPGQQLERDLLIYVMKSRPKQMLLSSYFYAREVKIKLIASAIQMKQQPDFAQAQNPQNDSSQQLAEADSPGSLHSDRSSGVVAQGQSEKDEQDQGEIEPAPPEQASELPNDDNLDGLPQNESLQEEQEQPASESSMCGRPPQEAPFRDSVEEADFKIGDETVLEMEFGNTSVKWQPVRAKLVEEHSSKGTKRKWHILEPVDEWLDPHNKMAMLDDKVSTGFRHPVRKSPQGSTSSAACPSGTSESVIDISSDESTKSAAARNKPSQAAANDATSDQDASAESKNVQAFTFSDGIWEGRVQLPDRFVLGRRRNLATANKNTWHRALSSQAADQDYHAEILKGGYFIVPDAAAPIALPKATLRAVNAGAKDPRTRATISNFQLANFQGDMRIPDVVALPASVLAGKRVVEACGEGGPRGLAQGGQMEGTRGREGVAEGTVRFLLDGTKVYVVAPLLIEESPTLPFTFLVLCVDIESKCPILVPNTTIMAHSLACERGLDPGPQVCEQERRDYFLLALPLLGDAPKDDDNCFMMNNTASGWKHQVRISFSPTFAKGRPSKPRADGRAVLRPQESEKKVDKKNVLENTGMASLKVPRSKLPRGTDDEDVHSMAVSAPPLRDTASIPAAAASMDFRGVVAAATRAAELAANKEADRAGAQLAMQASSYELVRKESEKASKALQEAAYLKGKTEALELSSEKREEEYQRSLQQAENYTAGFIKVSQANQEHGLAQQAQVMNFALLQGGNSTLPVANPSLGSSEAGPLPTKKEKFLVFLEKCDLEEHLDSFWQYGIKSAEAVKYLTEKDRLELSLREFEFSRLKDMAKGTPSR